MEIRPGYLGKWIEISCMDTGVDPEVSAASGHKDIVDSMRQRFLTPSLEAKQSQPLMNQNSNRDESANVDLLNASPDLIEEQKRIELEIQYKNAKRLSKQEARRAAEQAQLRQASEDAN